MKRIELLQRWSRIAPRCPLTGASIDEIQEEHDAYISTIVAERPDDVKGIGSGDLANTTLRADGAPAVPANDSMAELAQTARTADERDALVEGGGAPSGESDGAAARNSGSGCASPLPQQQQPQQQQDDMDPSSLDGSPHTPPMASETPESPAASPLLTSSLRAEAQASEQPAAIAALTALEFFVRYGEWMHGSITEHVRRSLDIAVYKQLLASEIQVVKTAEPTAAPTTKKEKAFALMRSAVSQNKVRFQEDGFDLDLTYITERIIAMGFPSHGKESYFRNPVDEVERFFNKRHPNHYRIYNLCSERHYDSNARFGGRFRRFPFDDHNAPHPIKLIPDFCRDATMFLKEHEENVVAIHCKAGKGRTGLMISCLLMYSNPSLRSPGDALSYFGEIRTSDGKGVTIPSQMRYVRYWDAVMRLHGGHEPPLRALRLKSVATKTGVRPGGVQCDLYFTIEENNKEIFDSRNAFKQGIQRAADGGFIFDIENRLAPGLRPVLCGDVKFFFYHRNKMFSDEHLFHFWLNTTLCSLSEALPKKELDKACKDKKHEVIDQNLVVLIEFEDVPDDARVLQHAKLRAKSSIGDAVAGGSGSPPGSAATLTDGTTGSGASGSGSPSTTVGGSGAGSSTGGDAASAAPPGSSGSKKEGGFLSKFFGSK